MKRVISLGMIFILAFAIVPTSTITVSAQPDDRIPVVILFKHHDAVKHKAMVEGQGGQVKTSFKIINGISAKLSLRAIEKLKKDPDVASIDPDVRVTALDSSADTQIRADQVWPAGDTGKGVSVAILDTGIDTTHPEFSGRIVLCHSELTHTDTCTDGNGHGTHVAGIIGASGVNPSAKGVAPAVSYYIDQVLDSTGSGTLSGIISGIDWAVGNHTKVISMSLGTSPIVTTQPNCDTSYPSLTSAINAAVSSGVTVVAAAGNSGTSGVGAPGCISSTITVGAVDNTNTIASFSSQGGPMADHGISAPGVNIFSSVPTGSCQLCSPTGYLTLSGTSMATPHVTGTVALLLAASPSLTPTAIKNAIFGTACTSTSTPACPTGEAPNNIYGHGRVDALSAFNAVSTPPPPVPDFSIGALPTSVNTVAGSSTGSTVTLSSLNSFSGSVNLAATPAIAGVTTSFTTNPVALSSGGSMQSTLKISTASAVTPGTYTLTLTGTSGSLSHQTAVKLTVTAPIVNPDFSILVSPQSISTSKGHAATATITITSLGGFSSAVNLSVHGKPSGVSLTLTPNPVTPPSGSSVTSKLTLTPWGSAVLGTYSLSIKGVSGTITHSNTLTLIVSAH